MSELTPDSVRAAATSLAEKVAGELSVWYQPVMRLSDGQCVGAEALVRWEHPDHGLLGPDEFIPVAEEAGLIAAAELLPGRSEVNGPTVPPALQQTPV